MKRPLVGWDDLGMTWDMGYGLDILPDCASTETVFQACWEELQQNAWLPEDTLLS